MHSFGFYFRKGRELAKLLYKKRSFFDKLLLTFYYVASFFGKFFFFTRPLFIIGDQNIALMLNEGHDVEYNKIFEGVNEKKRYSGLLVSNLFIDIMLFGALVILVVPLLTFGLVGPFESSAIIIIVISVLGSVVLAILSFALTISYAPMGYVATKGLNLSAGDILYLSKKASKGNKGLIFGLYFLHYLFIFLVFAGIGLGVFLFYTLASNNDELFIIPVILLLLSIPVFEVFVISKIKLSLGVALYSLYSDAIKLQRVVLSRKAISSKEEYVAVFADDMEEK